MSAALKVSLTIAVTLSLLLGTSFAGSQSLRPNIVWLISEDNSVHESKLYLQSGADMPNVGKLAEEGVIFTHALSVAPVCSVARSTLATGSYPSRLGVQYHRCSEAVTLPASVRPVFELPTKPNKKNQLFYSYTTSLSSTASS